MTNGLFKKLMDAVNPQLQIGGLEVSDAYIRYASIRGKRVDFVATKLPPGIVEDGKIKDKDRLLAILAGLHDRIVKKKNKKIWVIASIPDGNVYTEMFTLPKTTAESLNESALLNLQMISPIDYATAHADWHLAGEKSTNGVSQLEILGAFVSKQAVEEFEQIADRAGFEIAAIEFPMIALARAIVQLGDGFEKGKNYLLFKLGSDGIAFGLLRNVELYFLHVVGWGAVYGQERRVTLDSLKKMVVDEIHKVLSFYETHWEGSLTDMYMVTPTFEDELKKTISENFPKLVVQTPSLRQFKTLTLGWLSVLGAACRGVIPRSEDALISLATTGTEKKYEVYQATNFVRLWRNVVVTALVAMIILFGGLDIFLTGSIASQRQQLAGLSQNQNGGKLDQLQQEAILFNKKVGMLTQANQERSAWSNVLADINQLAGSTITIKRIQAQSIDGPITVFGETASNDLIGAFQHSLEQDPRVSDVSFQLASVTRTDSGKLGFSISFRIKK